MTDGIVEIRGDGTTVADAGQNVARNTATPPAYTGCYGSGRFPAKRYGSGSLTDDERNLKNPPFCTKREIRVFEVITPATVPHQQEVSACRINPLFINPAHVILY
jgi:hypothetical protein